MPTAIIMAKNGFEVTGFDINTERVERINNYDPIIKEPEIFEKLGEVLKAKKFIAMNTIQPAECFVIAVPTPFNTDKTADLSYVWNAASEVARVIKPQNLVILESTVPVGTTDKLAHLIAQKTSLRAGIDFFVAHCPERVLPGKIFHELIHNSRIIGGINTLSTEQARALYSSFVSAQLYLTNAATAEMVKLVENSCRDVQIAFANQIYDMATNALLNPFEVINLANKHPRVNILQPSCGVGGHCISVDPWFLIETFPKQTELLRTARIINDKKPFAVIEKIKKNIAEWQAANQRQCNVLLLGASYKANSDDLRESPALLIAQQLHNNESVLFQICEPNVEQSMLESLVQKKSVELQDGIQKADIIVCLVKHHEFNILQEYTNKIIIDVCGLLYTPNTNEQNSLWQRSSYSHIKNSHLQEQR